MANPWAPKKGKGGDNPYARKKAGATNGSKPKRTLGDLLGTKKPPKPLPKKQNKRDFYADGVLFWNAVITGDTGAGYRDGVRRPYGTVDVSNGDVTYTMHNQYGSWMHNIHGSASMAEPARVAQALGIGMTQMEMSRALTDRFEAELKEQGIPTLHQQRLRIEKEQEAARKKVREQNDSSKDKSNPYARKKT